MVIITFLGSCRKRKKMYCNTFVDSLVITEVHKRLQKMRSFSVSLFPEELFIEIKV